MKIAIPTNDRVSITKRTGRTKEFAVYEIANGAVINTQYHTNPHTHEDHNHDHGEHTHSHAEITDLLSDCDLMVVQMVGNHMKRDLDAGALKYEITKETDLGKIVEGYL